MVEVSHLPGKVHDPATGERANHGFTPNGDGKRDTARFTLFIRDDEPHATVAIVGPSLRKVRTLDDDVSLEKDQPVDYEWDGKTNSGKLAPPDNYRIEVVLPSLDRDVVFPRRIALISR
jgi:flagellar hook assembly protein FlgD